MHTRICPAPHRLPTPAPTHTHPSKVARNLRTWRASGVEGTVLAHLPHIPKLALIGPLHCCARTPHFHHARA